MEAAQPANEEQVARIRKDGSQLIPPNVPVRKDVSNITEVLLLGVVFTPSKPHISMGAEPWGPPVGQLHSHIRRGFGP